MNELDTRLAKMVGWTYTEDEDIGGGTVRRWSNLLLGLKAPHTPPSYSADIADCFGELVPWLAAKGFIQFQLIRTTSRRGIVWWAEFGNGVEFEHGMADTPERAIALAAEAVGKAKGWIIDGDQTDLLRKPAGTPL